jgi:hypothetical protein
LDKEKSVLGDANQLPGNVDRLSGKADLGTEPGSGKVELGLGCEVGLREEVKPTSVERFKEESVTKKNEVGKDHLQLSGLRRVMLTLWRTLKDIHCRKL